MLTGEENDLDYVGSHTVSLRPAIVDVSGGSTKLVGYRHRLKGINDTAFRDSNTDEFLTRDRIEPHHGYTGEFLGAEFAKRLVVKLWSDSRIGRNSRTLARIDRKARIQTRHYPWV